MRKNLVILFVSIAVLAMIFWISGNSYRNAYKNGWQWVKNYNDKFLDPGNLWIIKMINDKYCHSAKVENFWKDRWEKEFKNHPYKSAFNRLFDRSFVYKIDYNIPKEIRSLYFDDALVEALYCDQSPISQESLKRLLDTENDSGYDLTHKFLAMNLMKESGCFDNLDEKIKTTAQKIVDEENSKTDFDDLYAERTAFLLSFGFRDLIKKDWINKIIANQKESGAWATPVFGNEHFENPHTTILSLWVLAQYYNTCPLTF